MIKQLRNPDWRKYSSILQIIRNIVLLILVLIIIYNLYIILR